MLQSGEVRKLLSILLLAVFGLPIFATLLASGQSVDAGLPACCRRNGAHHCAMRMAEAGQQGSGDSQEPRWKTPAERCPFCPASIVSAQHHDAASLPPERTMLRASFSHPTGVVQTESKRRMARDRSRQKRGPPTTIG